MQNAPALFLFELRTHVRQRHDAPGQCGEAGRGVFQKYRMSRRDGLHWAFARCIQMPDDASLANWKRQRAQYLERQRIKAEKQAAEAAQNT